jgi:hypothetical protein
VRLLPELVRLAGWGEGLTPAGDDFLVGIAAALQAPLPGRAARQHVLAALGPALRACSERTTPIAAHYLRLAGDGHFDAPLLALRDALLAWRDAAAVDAALERLLDIGASSGADMLGGLLAGLDAVLWPHTVPMAA